MIVALAGRRIDAPDAKAKRFPLELAGSVKKRLIDCFVTEKSTHVVCSGACGADLLALQAAKELMIGKTMVLPFDPDTFRSTSVVDRPGDWGMIYDKIVQELKGTDQLVVLNYDKDDPETYEKTNLQILDQAQKLADHIKHNHSPEKYSPGEIMALIVWEGKPKDADDTTYHFMQEAEKRDFKIREIILKSGN